MENKYGVELQLIVDKFKNQMQRVSNTVKSWGNDLKRETTVKPEIILDTSKLDRKIEFINKRLNELNKISSKPVVIDGNTVTGTSALTEKQIEIYNRYVDLLNQTEQEKRDLIEAVNEYNGVTKETNNILKENESITNNVVQSEKNLGYNIKEVNKESKKSDLGTAFTKAEGKARRFLLSLFSIRSIWSLISRASSTYLNENEQLNQSVQLTASIFGNMLGPAIERVVSIAQYGAIFIARLIQAFTTYDVLAKVTASSMKKVASAGKEMNKSLASFDTITNLGSSTNGIASGIADSIGAFNDLQDKINVIDDIFSKYGDKIKIATELLLAFAGIKTISKLGSLIGVAGTTTAAGSGLMGVLSALSLIAAIGVLTITINWQEEKNKKAGNEIKETMQGLIDTADILQQKNDELTNSFKRQVEQGELSEDEIASRINMQEDLIETVINETNSNNKNADSLKLAALFSEGARTAYANLLQARDKNIQSLGVYTDNLVEMVNTTKLSSDQQARFKETLTNALNTLEENKRVLKKNSDEYKEQQQRIDNVKDALAKLDGKTAKNKITVDVDADTTKAKNKTDNWLKSLYDNTLGNLFGTLGKGFKSMFSFDVGTNYVPYDTVAQVHKGEMIVPAKYNPMTSGIGGNNEETNYLLNRLIDVVESKDFNTYLDSKEIGKSTVNYINSQNRIQGKSVIQ